MAEWSIKSNICELLNQTKLSVLKNYTNSWNHWENHVYGPTGEKEVCYFQGWFYYPPCEKSLQWVARVNNTGTGLESSAHWLALAKGLVPLSGLLATAFSDVTEWLLALVLLPFPESFVFLPYAVALRWRGYRDTHQVVMRLTSALLFRAQGSSKERWMVGVWRYFSFPRSFTHSCFWDAILHPVSAWAAGQVDWMVPSHHRPSRLDWAEHLI
jgi:hypothetical protein